MADRFELDAIAADDALLDLLAAGGESAVEAGEHDPALRLLAELRLAVEVEDEFPVETIDDPESFLARCAALNPVTDPRARKIATRTLALSVAAVAALSVSGVAAAFTGNPLSPYEKVIEKVVDGLRPEVTLPKDSLDGLSPFTKKPGSTHQSADDDPAKGTGHGRRREQGPELDPATAWPRSLQVVPQQPVGPVTALARVKLSFDKTTEVAEKRPDVSEPSVAPTQPPSEPPTQPPTPGPTDPTPSEQPSVEPTPGPTGNDPEPPAGPPPTPVPTSAPTSAPTTVPTAPEASDGPSTAPSGGQDTPLSGGLGTTGSDDQDTTPSGGQDTPMSGGQDTTGSNSPDPTTSNGSETGSNSPQETPTTDGTQSGTDDQGTGTGTDSQTPDPSPTADTDSQTATPSETGAQPSDQTDEDVPAEVPPSEHTIPPADHRAEKVTPPADNGATAADRKDSDRKDSDRNADGRKAAGRHSNGKVATGHAKAKYPPGKHSNGRYKEGRYNEDKHEARGKAHGSR